MPTATATAYPHIICESPVYNVFMRASNIYGGGGCAESFEVLVSMAIADGYATAEGVFPAGAWNDSEGFLDSELSGIAAYIQRNYNSIRARLYTMEGREL